MKTEYKVLVRNLRVKLELRIYRHSWESNIEEGLKQMVGEAVEWIQLAQDNVHFGADVNTVMDLQAPESASNVLTRHLTSSFARTVFLIQRNL
jgi:hypothetical protein